MVVTIMMFDLALVLSYYLYIDCDTNMSLQSLFHVITIIIMIIILADVDSQDDNGWTPLHYAVMSNSTECLKFILQEGADKEIRDYQKRRPLDLAKSKNHGDCIAILCYTGSSLA